MCPAVASMPVIMKSMQLFSGAIARAIANLKIVGDSAYPANVSLAVHALCETFRGGNKLMVFGNGGSAADAQHIASELTGRFSFNRKPLPALALTTDSSFLTAWSNDCSFDDIFARQVEAHGKPGDVAWGISTSGNSKNVVTGLRKAKELGLRTIGFTGHGGGAAAAHSDILLAVPLKVTAEIQEVHQLTYHYICGEVERDLFSS